MKKRVFIVILTLGILYAMGCGSKPQTTPDPTGQVSLTPEPFNTVQVQPTVVVKATSTPTGTPTDTPTPTNTPTDTPSPTPTLTVDEEVLVTERKSADIPFIMLDAGHGGGDPGACADNDKIKESEINLSIVWKVANKLMDRGMQVVMTRNSDKKPSTYDSKTYKKLYPDKKETQRFNYFRRDLSDNTDVDMFISVHQNSSSLLSAKGCEVWRTRAFNKLSSNLAQTVFDGITEKIGYSKYIIGDASKDNPAKNLIVLQTNKPSILIECGYLTNEEELKLLVTDEFQEKIANGIVQGIIAYYKEQGMYPDFNFGE